MQSKQLNDRNIVSFSSSYVAPEGHREILSPMIF
jgi:hypothetical protein